MANLSQKTKKLAILNEAKDLDFYSSLARAVRRDSPTNHVAVSTLVGSPKNGIGVRRAPHRSLISGRFS
jgi:hypothetical protein